MKGAPFIKVGRFPNALDVIFHMTFFIEAIFDVFRKKKKKHYLLFKDIAFFPTHSCRPES
jgi:hypothetical protein